MAVSKPKKREKHMSKQTMKITIEVDGMRIDAERIEQTSRGSDPTIFVTYTGRASNGVVFKLEEFQGILTGFLGVDDYRVDMNDKLRSESTGEALVALLDNAANFTHHWPTGLDAGGADDAAPYGDATDCCPFHESGGSRNESCGGDEKRATSAPRFVVEPYYGNGTSTPSAWLVWDRVDQITMYVDDEDLFETPEAAQRAADKLNATVRRPKAGYRVEHAEDGGGFWIFDITEGVPVTEDEDGLGEPEPMWFSTRNEAQRAADVMTAELTSMSDEELSAERVNS